MQFTPFHPSSVGETIKADWARRVERAIAEMRPRPLPNQTMSRDAYGVQLGPYPDAVEEIEFTEAFPFKVRWFYTSKDRSNGEWQIFLPCGCVTLKQGNIVQSYMPVNDDSKDPNGEALFKWYSIEQPSPSDATVGTSGRYVAKQWTVFVNMKPWPRLKVTTKKDDKDFKGCQWSVPVATVSEVDIEGENVLHRVNQLRSGGTIENVLTSTGQFDITYEMVNKSKKDSLVTVRVINICDSFGRLFFETNNPKIITDWKSVWLKITHQTEEFKLTIEKELEDDDAVSDDDKTVFKLYDLEDNIVTADNRNFMPTFDFYTNPPDDPEQTT